MCFADYEKPRDRLSGWSYFFGFANHDSGVRVGHRYGETCFSKKLNMLFHTSPSFDQTVFNGCAPSGEALKIWGIKAKEGGIVRGFDNKGVRKICHHRVSLMPADFRIARQVPDGTSLAP
jgi:hypothetical protein